MSDASHTMADRKNKTSRKDKLVGWILISKVKWLTVFAVILVAISSFLLPKYVDYKTSQQLQLSKAMKPKYWNVCEAKWNSNGNLRTMNRVFERLGYEFVNASKGGDWDVLWSLE